MARRKPSAAPLVVYVESELLTWSEWADFGDKLSIRPLTETDGDLILGPRCWRMLPELRKYLKDAVKAAGKARDTRAG